MGSQSTPCEHSRVPHAARTRSCGPIVADTNAFPAEPSIPRSHAALVPMACIRPSRPLRTNAGSAERSMVRITCPRPRLDTGGMSGSSLVRQCCASPIAATIAPRTTHREYIVSAVQCAWGERDPCQAAHPLLASVPARMCMRACARSACVRMCALACEGESPQRKRRAPQRRTLHTGGSAEHSRVRPHGVRAGGLGPEGTRGPHCACTGSAA